MGGVPGDNGDFVKDVNAPVGPLRVLLGAGRLEADNITHGVKDRKTTRTTIDHGGSIVGKVLRVLACETISGLKLV